MGKTRNTGKLATQIQFDNSNNLVIGTSASSSFNTSGSVNAIGGITGSIFGIGNPTSFSSSISSDLNSIHDVTTSNISRLNSIEEKTGSFATTGSNSFYGTQVFSGSVFIASDLVVQGSSSIQYISASSVSIGTNIVQLNTATPSVRFAGLSVQDSGSSAGITGSILWDSLCNRWIYSNPSTIGYSGGMLMSGPRTSTLGTESPLTCNYIAKSGGGDHLYDSCIYESGGRIGIGTTSDYGILSIYCVDNTVICPTQWGTSSSPNLVMTLYNGSQCVGSASGIRLVTRDSGASIWNIYNISTGVSTGDLSFGNGTGGSGTEKMRITNNGLACFSNYLQAGGYYATGSVTVGMPFDTGGTKAYFDASSINGPALSLVSDGVGRTIRLSATTGSTAVGKIDMNSGEMNIGTNVSLPFVIYTNNYPRVTTTSTGITSFVCQVCAPYYAGGTSYTIDFLVVAGGGGGGGSEMSNGFGGGGGAGGGGGYLASSISVNCGSTYPIVVGTGGTAGASCLAGCGSGQPGSTGGYSSAFGFIAIGGGAGAGDENTPVNIASCTNGGSGGGQGGDSGGCAGIAVIGQGNNGSIRYSRTGGGGGGAAAAANNNTGGSGRQWLDGNYYAGGGGGGGGGNDQTQWLGGVGGGGNGSRSFPGGGTTGEDGGQATAGQACTGGGGGGAGSGYLQGGMPGGSGIVIIRYFGCTRGSGGTISSSGGYTYHRFGANGTYTA
jgi:hypothetical protein